VCPKKLIFDQPSVLSAAVEVIRRDGLDALSARSVARELRSSVAPVYYSFRSMEKLRSGVLDWARRMLEEKAGQPYTDIRFLNIGVGVALFARDEEHLFRALFLSQEREQDISSDFLATARALMKEDTLLRRLPDHLLERLWGSFWIYALGLATAINFGWGVEKTDKNIIRLLKNTVNTVIFAEIAGIADCESAENAREWSRLLMEKRIILPFER